MAIIKSALELAMERANQNTVNKDALAQEAKEKEGRILAAKALNENNPHLKSQLEALGLPALKGAVKTLLANLTLPRAALDMQRFALAQAAFIQLSSETETLLAQLEAFLPQYLEQKEQLKAALERQFEPMLRQKEAQIAAQTGRIARLTIDNDPEALSLYKEELAQLEGRYQEALGQAKYQLARFFNLENS